MASKRRRWRSGNFVIRLVDVPTLGEEDWKLSDGRIRQLVKKGEIGTVEVVEVSSLDGAWGMRLMPGSIMETMMRSFLGDEERVEDEWVSLVLTNLESASSIPNGHYHQGLLLLTAVYMDPSLVTGGSFNRKSRAFRKDAKRLLSDFLAWRKEYDAELERRYTKEDETRDESALILENFDTQNGNPLK